MRLPPGRRCPPIGTAIRKVRRYRARGLARSREKHGGHVVITLPSLTTALGEESSWVSALDDCCRSPGSVKDLRPVFAIGPYIQACLEFIFAFPLADQTIRTVSKGGLKAILNTRSDYEHLRGQLRSQRLLSRRFPRRTRPIQLAHPTQCESRPYVAVIFCHMRDCNTRQVQMSEGVRLLMCACKYSPPRVDGAERLPSRSPRDSCVRFPTRVGFHVDFCDQRCGDRVLNGPSLANVERKPGPRRVRPGASARRPDATPTSGPQRRVCQCPRNWLLLLY